MNQPDHRTLTNGIELAVLPIPDRHVIAIQIRVLAGLALEPAEQLGLTRVLEEAIDKGTEKRSGRELSDAFDAIGATRSVGVGRETFTFTCTVLPEHFERVVELHAELLRTPTFPEDVVKTAIELTRQELVALEDDAQGLSDLYLSRQALGPLLGRHPLGTAESLARLTRDNLVDYWQRYFCTGRTLVVTAGAIDAERAATAFEKHFEGFGDATPAGRSPFPIEFTAKRSHYTKQLEQEHIGLCWPAVDAKHDDFPTQCVMLGVLSGGMSGRLFTEVREKLGLVYWVSAWQETPRGSGLVFMGASTTPARCDKTYNTLLREVDRLADDIEEDELERAKTGITASWETRGDGTRARCSELASDLFIFGRPISVEEKVAKIEAVTIEDVKRYLAAYPRNKLSVVTLGPNPLADAPQGAAAGSTTNS